MAEYYKLSSSEAQDLSNKIQETSSSYDQLKDTMHLEKLVEGEEDRLMTLSVGPQHPGSGHFRFTVKLDGDMIVHCDPDPGYVHRGEEKMCEYRILFKIFYIWKDL